MANAKPNPIPPLTQKDIERFWSKVDVRGPDECWPWKEGTTEAGYGRFKYQNIERKASRIAYFISTGEDPGEEFHVLHSCDFPPCQNPNHLHKGTEIDNIRERCERGRSATGDRSGSRLYPERLARGDKNLAHIHPEIRQGERNGRAKLSVAQVLEIRKRYDAGERNVDSMGAEYGITGSMISWIGMRKFWKSIPG